jgi:mannosyltransferase OCH1-like enzyme
MIPKIIHHVWVGSNPLPAAEKSYIQSWKKHHPDWHFMFWGNNEIKKLEINHVCQQALHYSGNTYALQADIIRLIAVNTFGGFYIDTDIECFKNIDNLLNHKIEFIGLRPHFGNWITNAFFGSIKNSATLNSAISNIRLTRPLKINKNPFGPTFLTRNVRQTFYFAKNETITDKVSDKCKILDHNFWSTHNPDRFCRHYFRASWRK